MLKSKGKIFFLFAPGKGKSSKSDLYIRLTIRYFDTVGFLPTKTPPPDYSSARATVPLWPWFQDPRVKWLNNVFYKLNFKEDDFLFYLALRICSKINKNKFISI
jgi:hypothetical protein